MAIDTQAFKVALSEEMEEILRELKTVGVIDPENTEDWIPNAGDVSSDTAEIEDRASVITDFEDRSAIEFELETRMNEIKQALLRIESGTFGICEVGSEEIEIERLKVNPSARTCKAHMS